MISLANHRQDGSDVYSCSYTYTPAGDRYESVYTAPSGVARWRYSDYVSVGLATGPSRAFQTLTKLDTSGNPTPEEFHYAYDAQGRLRNAAFAQTPQAGQGYNVPAQVRARAYYAYDPGGRLLGVYHYWDTLQPGGTYLSEAVLANGCYYEPTRGLKTSSSFWVKNPNNPAQFISERAESFGYDAALDCLTVANYNDGLPGPSQSWSYNAAGNRNDSVCRSGAEIPMRSRMSKANRDDNLNRATSVGGVSCTNDILGNRLTKGSNT